MSHADDPSCSDDELLSAYLDDALSGPERQAVERRLDDDPAARRLLAELRAISERVQSLPREKLDPSLRESVLRALRGERPEPPSDATQRRLPRPSDPELEERRGFGRRFGWAALAAAAALLLAVTQPDGLPRDDADRVDGPRDVARAEPRRGAAPPQASWLPAAESGQPADREAAGAEPASEETTTATRPLTASAAAPAPSVAADAAAGPPDPAPVATAQGGGAGVAKALPDEKLAAAGESTARRAASPAELPPSAAAESNGGPRIVLRLDARRRFDGTLERLLVEQGIDRPRGGEERGPAAAASEARRPELAEAPYRLPATTQQVAGLLAACSAAGSFCQEIGLPESGDAADGGLGVPGASRGAESARALSRQAPAEWRTYQRRVRGGPASRPADEAAALAAPRGPASSPAAPAAAARDSFPGLVEGSAEGSAEVGQEAGADLAPAVDRWIVQIEWVAAPAKASAEGPPPEAATLPSR